MDIFVISTLAGVVTLAWLWHKKPALKAVPPRSWPAARGKTGAKPKLT